LHRRKSALKVQVWVAPPAHVLVAIADKQLGWT